MMIRQGDLRAISLVFLALILLGSAVTLGVGYVTAHKVQAQIRTSSSLVTTDNYVVENSTTDGSDMLVKSQSTGQELKLHCTGSMDEQKDGNGETYMYHRSDCFEFPVGDVVILEKWE